MSVEKYVMCDFCPYEAFEQFDSEEDVEWECPHCQTEYQSLGGNANGKRCDQVHKNAFN